VEKNLPQLTSINLNLPQSTSINLSNNLDINKETNENTTLIEKQDNISDKINNTVIKNSKNRKVSYEHNNKLEDELLSKNQIICCYCSSIISKKNKYRHQRNTCPLIPENKRRILLDKYQKNKKHINCDNALQIRNHNVNCNNKNINECNNNIITNNTTNNIMNNNHNINNNNITIKINPFGQEDLSSLTNNDIFRLINRAYKMIPDTMKAIHHDIPENRNMFIPNVNRPIVKIFNGEEWVFKSLDYVTTIVSDNIKDNIEQWTSKYNEKLSPIKRNALNQFVSKCLDGKMENEFKNEMKMFLMTYSNDIKDYINKEVVKKLESFNEQIDLILSQ